MIPGGMVESQSGSRVGCVNPACWAGSHMGSRVGIAGSHQLRQEGTLARMANSHDCGHLIKVAA